MDMIATRQDTSSAPCLTNATDCPMTVLVRYGCMMQHLGTCKWLTYIIIVHAK